jgi:tryptophan 7-halogenase
VMGVGQVYASAHQSNEEALQELTASSGELLAEPRLREFRAGRRQHFWQKNVVAIGGAAGAMDPLAAAEQHVAINGTLNLLDHFPDRQFDPANIASYNATLGEEFERIRDFCLLHYRLSRRDDSPFWREFASLELPETLAQRIDLYRSSGRVMLRQPELFNELDWFWIFEGMGVVPRDYDPLVDTIDYEQVKKVMLAISQKIAADTGAAPTHDSFFAQANARLAGVRRATAAQSAG